MRPYLRLNLLILFKALSVALINKRILSKRIGIIVFRIGIINSKYVFFLSTTTLTDILIRDSYRLRALSLTNRRKIPLTIRYNLSILIPLHRMLKLPLVPSLITVINAALGSIGLRLHYRVDNNNIKASR